MANNKIDIAIMNTNNLFTLGLSLKFGRLNCKTILIPVEKKYAPTNNEMTVYINPTMMLIAVKFNPEALCD